MSLTSSILLSLQMSNRGDGNSVSDALFGAYDMKNRNGSEGERGSGTNVPNKVDREDDLPGK